MEEKKMSTVTSWYEVWHATEDDFVKHSTHKNFENALECANALRAKQCGTIMIKRISSENFYAV